MLRCYTSDGKVYELEIQDDEKAYDVVLMLKNHIPHLLYGPNLYHDEIYKRNPAELMMLAKKTK